MARQSIAWRLAGPSFPGGFAGCALHPVTMGLPPRLVTWRHVQDLARAPHGPVDEFPDDVCLTPNVSPKYYSSTPA